MLTFNFDNLLARSCGLLGQYPPTYDFTAANLNLHRLIDDPAIVHLHGQGHGFVQLNTDSETEEHAARLKEFVDHTLSESPTLFIGYSGKNDAFLPQIEEQFSDQHRLFWVDMGDQAPEHLQSKLLTSSLAHYMSCKNGADLFLIELARKLECFPPTILTDPYQHLLDELDDIADYPISKEDSSEDKNENRSIRSNTSTQDILLGTRNKLKEVQQQDKEVQNDFLKEYLQDNHEKIIQTLEDKKTLNSEQSLWLARAYLSVALREPDQLEEVNLYEKLIERFKESKELDVQEQVAKAFLNKGVVLETLEQPESAIDVYDQLIAKFSESEVLALQEIVSGALINKGIVLSELEQFERAIDVCDELIAKFGESDTPILQQRVADAYNGLGYSKLMMAKQRWQNSDVVQSYLYQAKEYFSQALIKSPESDYSLILGNMAYTEFLQENIFESEKYLREALKLGQQHLYDETIEDIAKHPIDPDNDFRSLLDSIWDEINE